MTSLADSRFDWPRVMHELSLILPSNVWLTNLTASVSSEVSAQGGTGVALRSAIAGPALELVGCASSQAAVGGFVDALKVIDGVTRVGVQSSALGSESSETGSATASTCQTRQSLAQFQMVVAFDAAPVSAEEAGGEAAIAPVETSASTTTTESSSGESTASSEGEG
jgi:Tfp pilus assembly protein PilN